MEHNIKNELESLDAEQLAEEAIADTVQANEAMDDAFYGYGERDERDMLDVSEVNRSES